jgi:hypothetical protein
VVEFATAGGAEPALEVAHGVHQAGPGFAVVETQRVEDLMEKSQSNVKKFRCALAFLLGCKRYYSCSVPAGSSVNLVPVFLLVELAVS